MSYGAAEAEQALINRLLLDPRQLPLVASRLQPEDIGSSAERNAYRAMLRLQSENRPIDIVTLKAELEDPEELDTLFELTVAHHGPVDEYVDIILGAATRRRILGELEKVQDLVSSGEGDPLVALQDTFNLLAKNDSNEKLFTSDEMVDGYLGTLVSREMGVVTGLTWGIPGMDEFLLPAPAGTLVILAARPSVGKTAMAENIAHHWASLNRGPVLFVSVEMSRDQLMDRAIARKTGLNAEDVARGRLNAEEWAQAKAAAEELRSMAIEYLDDGEATTARVRSAAAKTRMRHDGRIGGIVVDYLQILGDKEGGDNENIRVARMSRRMKNMARTFDCPILLLSQLNRSAERENRPPRLSDLRDSGAVEQDADYVVVLHGAIDSPYREVHVLKQRQGRVGHFPVRYHGATVSFHAPSPGVDWNSQASSMVRTAPREDEEDLGW